MEEALDEFGVQQRMQQRMELASTFVNVGVGLASQPGNVPRARRPEGSNPSSPAGPSESVIVPQPEQDAQDELERVFRHELKSRHEPRTATFVYNEYYGLGDFEGKPIEGGLKALEDKYKTKWRRGDTAYQKAFSRIQQVVSCVNHAIKDQSREKENVLQQFDTLFDKKECSTLPKMVEQLKASGWLAKRTRKAADRSAEGPPSLV
jgi:hypothetical protein